MPTKKRKTQQKPIYRGFAVTSIPKKAPPEPTTPQDDSDAKVVPASAHAQVSHTAAQTHELIQDETLNAEERSLQELVDRLQEKTEKEIIRTIKTIETERRFSNTFPLLDLDAGVVSGILDMVRGSWSDKVPKRLDISDDSILTRLGVTYGVLRRLGYSEETVVRCLESIDGIDLEEAHEWLFLNCTDDELQPHTLPMDGKAPMPNLKSSVVAPTTPSGGSQANSPHVSELKLSTPQHNSTRLVEPLDDCDDPNIHYARLKLELDGASTGRNVKKGAQAHPRPFIEELHARLKAVKSHYLFDERDAEAHYRSELQKAEAASLQARLRGSPGIASMPSGTPTLHEPKGLPRQSQAKEVREDPDDFFDSTGEDGDGGLFEILEAMPSTEVSETGVTVTIRDMSLPKGKFERTSKTFLQGAIDKLDSFAVMTYRRISGASRAIRASLSVRWSSGKVSEWAMEDVACHDITQAEQYIATVALHALTFPAFEGFSPANLARGNTQTFFRLLTPAFRDFWDELEAKRKTSEDATNRAVWSKLKKIVEARGDQGKTVDRGLRTVTQNTENFNSEKGFRERVNSAQIMQASEARRSSPSYRDMLSQREKLPIAQFRDEIVQQLETSQVLVLSGETGCGKSTQVPAFILEDQLSRGKACKVYCAEPRRISAISLAQRVSQELGDSPGAVGTPASLVGYSIRLENNISRNTRLAYITYGIAIRMLEAGKQGESGITFDEITHIIIDEVHERSIESDFLLIVVRALLAQRPDLRVVLMSATLESEKISHYFGDCPVIHVPGRTFPVDIRYLEDAVELTHWSITETSPYAKRLDTRGKNTQEWSEDTAGANLSDHDDEAVPRDVKLGTRYSPKTVSTINLLDERIIPYDLIMRLLESVCFEPVYAKYSLAVLVFLPGIAEIRRLNDLLVEHAVFGSSHDFVIYLLHSSISSDNQAAVFEVPPPGIRKIVLATNIAETGVTIPDITCVIDTGKHKEMRFDEKRQFSRLVETYVAKSNAIQRRGRAGRVQEGLCFHLFTKIRHDTRLAGQPDPEIMRLSLSHLALRIKILKVDLGSSIEDVLSRALDPPSPANIQRAVSVLVEVRALTPNEEITPLGRLLSALPTDIHIGKFLLMATIFRCLDPALTIAATLNSKSPFLTPFGHESEADRAKGSFMRDDSDFLTMHNAFSSWRRVSSNGDSEWKFCKTNFLSRQNLQQIEELRQQFLAYLIDARLVQADKALVRQLSRARFNRSRTRFVFLPPEFDIYSENSALINAALTAGLYPKILKVDSTDGHWQLSTVTNSQAVTFHPSSVNFRRRLQDFGVNYLAFFTIMHSKKLYVWETGPVDDVALLLLCGDCNFKLVSDSAFVDHPKTSLRFRIPAKSNIALKYLRNKLAVELSERLQNKPSSGSQKRWMEMALIVLGKLQPEQSSRQSIILDIIVH